MKWWAYIALKQLFPSGKRVSFFALVSVLGVALGVLALFGTQSVMNGFHHEIAVKLIDTGGEVTVSAGGKIIDEKTAAALVEFLKKRPEVLKAEKVAAGLAGMLNDNTPAYPLLRSYDTFADDSVIPIREKGFVLYGDVGELDDDSIIISKEIAQSVGAGLGDILEVYSPGMINKLTTKDEIPLPAKLKVIGYLDTDFQRFDANAALVSLRRMQDLYDMGGGIHMISLKLKEGVDAEKFAEELNRFMLTPPLFAYTWLTGNAGFLHVIVMEKVMMSIIIMLIIIVASFSICSSLYTSVLRKTKEIGLQAAMGARPWEIAASYCFQGFLIGVFGALVGLGLTFLLLHFRDPIVAFIVGKDTLSQFYLFSQLPVKYEFYDGFRASAFAVILCTFAGFLPALRASRLKASEAMRNE